VLHLSTALRRALHHAFAPTLINTKVYTMRFSGTSPCFALTTGI
jgi:hypothetical protein